MIMESCTIGLEWNLRNGETLIANMSIMTYIGDVLKRFKMEQCKLVTIPFNVVSKLLEFLDEKFGNVQ